MTTLVYGISACSTVQKARDWLEARHVDYVFHDFKKQGVPADKLSLWLKKLGSNKVVNRQSLTWRRLSEADKNRADNPQQIIDLLIEKPTLIKRPLLEHDGKTICGFNEKNYQAIFECTLF